MNVKAKAGEVGEVLTLLATLKPLLAELKRCLCHIPRPLTANDRLVVHDYIDALFSELPNYTDNN
jgi:hypothetical protein